jgi:ABC-type molybdate transport system substrate-binding protein
MRLILLIAALCGLAYPTAGSAAEIRVISPGVISNSGLSDVAADFQKKTGIKVNIQVDGMGTIVNDIRNQSPPADVVMLPMDLMAGMALSGGLKPESFTPLGRVEIGLFVKPGFNTHPDISTVSALAAAMKTASAVFYSDPVSGSMQASMSERLLKRPEFAGVNGIPVKGDAEPALKRGDGDDKAMGLGLIHGTHSPANTPTENPYLIGMLPAELEMHMDMATAISARSAEAKDADAFISFALSAQMRQVWRSKGVDRY